MAFASSNQSPTIVVIGVTGTGKSTLCNVLTGKDPRGNDEDGFPVSEKPDACTWATTSKTAKWMGREQTFTIIDTPGLDDPNGRDTANIAAMVDELKKLEFVNAFLIVFNGQNPRLDQSLKSMMKIFQGMFGSEYLKNTIIQFSRWSFDTRAETVRKCQELTQQSQARDWNKKFREEFGAKLELPAVFIDAHYIAEDTKESNAFKKETGQLWNIISNLKPFPCKDFDKVLTENDQLIKDAEEANKKKATAEANTKISDKAAKQAREDQRQAEEGRVKAEAKKRKAEESVNELREAQKKLESEKDAESVRANKAEEMAAAERRRRKNKKGCVLSLGFQFNKSF